MFMKKIILFLPILTLVLARCDGGDSNSLTSGTSDNSSTSTAEPLPPPVVSDINGEEISHEANDGDIIKLMHMNDTHGSIEYLPDNNEPGMAYIAGYVNEKRAQENTDVVLLSSGDMFQGSLDSNINQGKLMIDIMKEMRFDSMSIGNHEFDWGVDVLAENAQYALDSDTGDWAFPFLSGNILGPEGQYEFGHLSTTFNRGPARISIIGSIDSGVYDSIDGPIVAGYEFVNAASMVISEAQRLRASGSDIIIYSTHDVDKRVAQTIANNVDAIFTGHNHHNSVLTMTSSTSKTIPIIESSSNGRALGEVDFIYDAETDSYELGTYKNTNVLDGVISLIEDDGVQAIYDRYLDAPAQDGPVSSDSLRSLKSDKVGEITSGSNYVTYDDVSIPKSNVATMFLYAQLEAYIDSYDIVGSCYNESRSAWTVGNITYADIYKAFPFDNATVIVAATGAQLKTWSTTTVYVDGISKTTLDNNTVYQIVTSTYIINNREEGKFNSIVNIDEDIFQRHVFYQQFLEATTPNPWG